MDTNQNVSKAEWLCAALIDFLPIAIIDRLFYAVTYIIWSFSLCSAKMEDGSLSWNNTDNQNFISNVNIAFLALYAAYILLKDAFGWSLGKRILGIKLQKNDEKAGKLVCVLRNMLLAICFGVGFYCIRHYQNFNNFLLNLFFFYCVAELLCVSFTNRTIGDNICQLKMVRNDDFVPGKINDHTYCIVTIIVLYVMTSALFVTFVKIEGCDMDSVYINSLVDMGVRTLIFILAYSFLLYKLIKPKGFRWTAIILFSLIKLGFSFKLISELYSKF